MSRIRSSTAVALLAVCAAGCPPGNNQPPDDGGTLSFVGRSCNVDAECGNLRCDKVRHQCICLSDESCKSGNPADPIRYCNNYTGLCVAEISGCTKAADCQITEYCDSAIRSCRPLKGFCEPCAADGECGGAQDNCLTDQNLHQTFCATACQVTADCPRGAACQMLGGALQCWPAPNPLTPNAVPSCKTFQGCTPDSLRTCNGNADCADFGTQRCDAASGKCVAITRVCAFGTVCDPRNKICVSECAADPDCGDPRLHCVNRTCQPIDECTTDAQCPLNKVCSLAPGQTSGQCLPFCNADLDCPVGQLCQRGADARYRCVSGCANNATCPLEQRCSSVTRTCEGQALGAVRTCQATSVCNPCELCSPTSFECFKATATGFPHCQPCTPGAGGCAGGTCVLMDDGLTYCAKGCGGAGQECPQSFVCLSLGAPLPDGGVQSACVPFNRQCKGMCQ